MKFLYLSCKPIVFSTDSSYSQQLSFLRTGGGWVGGRWEAEGGGVGGGTVIGV